MRSTISLKILLRAVPAVLVFFCLPPVSARAQMERATGATDYHIDTLQTKQLALEIDNLSFFKDNEFSGTVMKGYSLPGLWAQPKLTYQPLRNLKVEAGIHALIYGGANKFPAYAYHDIAKWKGNQYQNGAHIVPWFRAQLGMKAVNVVLGNLYSGINHNLSLPLYNPELMLSADPEFGFQVLMDTRPVHLDAWINWESFIFKGDTHQESFMVGVASKFRVNPDSSRLHAYFTVEGLAHHRGGEQDTAISVQTMMNGAVGAGISWNVGRRAIRQVNAKALLLGYAQQAGHLWPFSGGSAVYAEASVLFPWNLHLRGSWLMSNQFISLMGSPYFGSVSTKYEGARYTGRPQVLNLALDYSRTFAKRYTFGAKVETFYHMPGEMVDADGVVKTPKSGFHTSFGVYLRIRPRFVLGRF